MATSLSNLAVVYQGQGQHVRAETLQREALAIMENAVGPDHPKAATILNNLAQTCSFEHRHSEAEQLYQRAVRVMEKVLGPRHHDVAQSLNNLALLYQDQGQYEGQAAIPACAGDFEKGSGSRTP